MSRDLPSLNALRAFEAAARLHSISLAAEELHVTHGAVSRQVRLLEDDLGVALFGKDGRGVKLTDSGVRLRDACGDAFERLRGVCAEAAPADRRGPVRPRRTRQPAGALVHPAAGPANRALPDLRLQLSTSEGEFDPRRPGLDAMLWFAEPPWPADMQVFELAPERMGPVVSPRLAQETGLAQAPAARLLQEPLLHTASRPQAWPAWAASQGLAAEALRYGQGFEHLYYLLEAAVAGLGVAIAPEPLVRDDLAAGRLAAPWGFIETDARLALWVPARLHDPRAGRLAQWLREQLAG